MCVGVARTMLRASMLLNASWKQSAKVMEAVVEASWVSLISIHVRRAYSSFLMAFVHFFRSS